MSRQVVESAAHRQRDRLRIVLGLGIAILGIELVGAWISHSLALLADAGHVFADVSGTGLALLAIWMSARPATDRRSFGFYRAEILAAVLNAVLLFAIAALVLIEAWRRYNDPPVIDPGPVLVVATIALAANAVAAWLLRGGRQASLTVRGVYLEVLSDAGGSAAVLVSALIVATTGLRVADAVASALIGLLILPRTWALLRDAVDVLLEATPKDVNMDEVRRHILEAPGVVGVHDLHAWTITSGLNVVSAHVRISPEAEHSAVLDHLCMCLSNIFDIEHSTFQLEVVDRRESMTHA